MYQQIKDSLGNIQTDVIKRVADDAFIPLDPRNTDYATYQLWLTIGNTPLPA